MAVTGEHGDLGRVMIKVFNRHQWLAVNSHGFDWRATLGIGRHQVETQGLNLVDVIELGSSCLDKVMRRAGGGATTTVQDLQKTCEELELQSRDARIIGVDHLTPTHSK